jgi:hypothetical protein
MQKGVSHEIRYRDNALTTSSASARDQGKKVVLFSDGRNQALLVLAPSSAFDWFLDLPTFGSDL